MNIKEGGGIQEGRKESKERERELLLYIYIKVIPVDNTWPSVGHTASKNKNPKLVWFAN